ncbi:recombinase family protein [Bacillus cereus group sp. BfR-BA-01310]|uniref:recombinase family protein n=1 Tax=Bacillus cereus group sp. BfR-BA-01310 TaxID=2920287 RepID=UPI001F581A52|nr:recombinase family protein [Bacillus cereus group sp. BfR-BA-01310]
MIIGYICINDCEQKMIDGIRSLTEFGCEKIIKDNLIEVKKKRSELEKLFDYIYTEDVLVVESILCLGEKTFDILKTLQSLDEREVGFISLNEGIDTRTVAGKAMLRMIAITLELENKLIAKRIKNSLKKSKTRGKRLGRPPLAEGKISIALHMYDSNKYSIKEIVKKTGVSQTSLYRAINAGNKKHK